MKEIIQCFDDSSLFSGLETEYLQRKYYKECLNLLVSSSMHIIIFIHRSLFSKEPVERVIGSYQKEVNGKLVEVKDCSYDIPLLQSLQCLMRTDIVREQVLVS